MVNVGEECMYIFCGLVQTKIHLLLFKDFKPQDVIFISLCRFGFLCYLISCEFIPVFQSCPH